MMIISDKEKKKVLMIVYNVPICENVQNKGLYEKKSPEEV